MYLLDTHVLLWALVDDARLPKQIQQILISREHEVFVSACSIWEIFIKNSRGKLDLQGDVEDFIQKTGFKNLNITFKHAKAAALLPKHHEDPFDRMLIAQAKLENLKLITADAHFKLYEVSILTF
ncbi:MAG: type II toxin-antitoxin system VapC family toxin [Myxococcaceae bacterium]